MNRQSLNLCLIVLFLLLITTVSTGLLLNQFGEVLLPWIFERLPPMAGELFNYELWFSSFTVMILYLLFLSGGLMVALLTGIVIRFVGWYVLHRLVKSPRM